MSVEYLVKIVQFEASVHASTSNIVTLCSETELTSFELSCVGVGLNV